MIPAPPPDRVLDPSAITDLARIVLAGLVETCSVFVMDQASGRYTQQVAAGVACVLTRPSTLADGRRAEGIKERVLRHDATLAMPRDARVVLTAGLPANVGVTWNVVSGTQWTFHWYGTPVVGECLVEVGRP